MVPAAKSIGLVAGRTLARERPATLLAAFEHSFYLDMGDGLIAVVAADLYDGPLNIRVDAEDMAWLDLMPGDERWSIGPDGLTQDGRTIITLDGASIWRPASTDEKIDRQTVRRGLDHLNGLLASETLADDSLIRLVCARSMPRNAVERAAAPALIRLSIWLKVAFAEIPEADHAVVEKILGLGPGLTPAGDDLLGGVLITSRRLRQSAAVDVLAAAIDAFAPRGTTRISRVHLAAASEGYAAAPLHDLLEALLVDDRPVIRQTLDAAAKIGHSSGLDAISGMILALTAWLQIQERAPGAA